MKNYNLTTDKTWERTQMDLEDSFRKWEVTEWSTNYPKGGRLTGFNQSIEDRIVTLRYVKNGQTVVLSMGKQKRAVDNLRVLYLSVEAMRMNEARGISDVIESAYLQLAAPEQFNPYEVLGIFDTTPLPVAEVVYKTLAKQAHPDAGGSATKLAQLNKAIEAIRSKETK